MKIAIASDGNGQVALHTGHCRAFAIYEIKGESAVYVGMHETDAGACGDRHHGGSTREDENHEHEHQHEHEHGHGQGGKGGGGHQRILNAIDGCSVLLTAGMGRRLAADLETLGIRGVLCEPGGVQATAEAFAAGTLAEVTGNPHCRHR
jgi:predicted Fe-Mo cluster-binding NifX family protein